MNIYYEKIESCKIVLCSVILKPEIHPMVGMTVAVAVAIEEAAKEGKF